MKRKLLSAAVYAFFWLVFFFFARLIFILTHADESFRCGIGTLAATFYHGSTLDFSISAFILIIPLIILIVSIWLKGRWIARVMKWYTLLLLLICSTIIVGDTILYSYWGFRMDYTPLLYLNTPKDAAASVTTLTIAGFCFAVILLTTLFGFLYTRCIAKLFTAGDTMKHRMTSSAILLFLAALLIIPVRGGTGPKPLTAGAVYFSDKMFANHAAINVVWNVGSSVSKMRQNVNPYSYLDPAHAKELTAGLLAPGGDIDTVLNNQRPNILLIILESFGNSLIGPLGGDSLTTPCLNRYVKEGILFSNFYSSGNRTDKALPAILSGYPAQPAASILKEPRKAESLKSLTRIMDSLNYRTSFWYGGDARFANIESYLVSTGFRKIISMRDFSPSDYGSKWGVHDHILFQVLQDSLKNAREPFFTTVLTLSSHEPFETPVSPVFKGKDEQTRFRNSIHYTDKSLGDFLDRAVATEWWKNTLVILVADHCRRNSPDDLVYSQSIFKIPMLWLGGAVRSKGIRNEKTGSQTDIPVTLLDQLGVKENFEFGKDLFSKRSNSFAFYSFNEGFGFITDTTTYIFDHKLRGPVLMEGNGAEETGELGKAWLQVLYDDYLRR